MFFSNLPPNIGCFIIKKHMFGTLFWDSLYKQFQNVALMVPNHSALKFEKYCCSSVIDETPCIFMYKYVLLGVFSAALYLIHLMKIMMTNHKKMQQRKMICGRNWRKISDFLLKWLKWTVYYKEFHIISNNDVSSIRSCTFPKKYIVNRYSTQFILSVKIIFYYETTTVNQYANFNIKISILYNHLSNRRQVISRRYEPLEYWKRIRRVDLALSQYAKSQSRDLTELERELSKRASFLIKVIC